ncbi:hypothetical protein JCGZ_16257 [Jatropha curcas]|uniref:Uncharacterized protein n=1 Tax=Jatropha curcas TaxID=180498 RepID=A0A067LJG4_JATCU|nr:hypothetical protein JCGZ_16257 [Jatropha curcas]
MRSLSLAVVGILILMSRSSCLRAVSTPQEMISSNSFSFSMADTNMELELMMDSETNRMLAASTKVVTGVTGKRRSTLDCGRGKRYCLPRKSRKNPPRCNSYQRDLNQCPK